MTTNILLLPCVNGAATTSRDGDCYLQVGFQNSGAPLNTSGIAFSLLWRPIWSSTNVALTASTGTLYLSNNGTSGVLLIDIPQAKMKTLAVDTYIADLVAQADGEIIVCGQFTFTHTALGPCLWTSMTSTARNAATANSVGYVPGPGWNQFKGNWSSTVSYVVNDVVFDGYSTWIAIAPSLGQEPAIGSAFWSLIAKGLDPDALNAAVQSASASANAASASASNAVYAATTQFATVVAGEVSTLMASYGAVSASLTSEMTARVNSDTALSTSITNLSTTIAGNAAAISSESTARANADAALADQISSINATYQGANDGANLLSNSDLATTQGWVSSSTSGITASYGVDYSDGLGHNYFSAGVNVLYAIAIASPAAGQTISWQSPAVPVNAGGYYEASAYAAYGRATQAVVALRWLDATLAVLSTVDVGSGGTLNGGLNGLLTNFTQIGGFATAPAGAAFARAVFYTASDGTDGAPFMYVTRPMLKVANSGQTSLSPYVPGGSDPTPIITAQVTTEATARAAADGSMASQISTLTSNYGTVSSGLSTEATARSNGDGALSSQITALTTTVNGNTSGISTEATARANGDTANANAITALTSTVNGNTSAISSEATARANADSALSTAVTNLSTTVGGHSASIGTLTSSVNGLSVQYSLTGTIDNTTGGFIFSGVKQAGGATAFTMTFNSNVIINGSLLINGSVANAAVGTEQITALRSYSSYSTVGGSFNFTFPQAGNALFLFTCDMTTASVSGGDGGGGGQPASVTFNLDGSTIASTAAPAYSMVIYLSAGNHSFSPSFDNVSNTVTYTASFFMGSK